MEGAARNPAPANLQARTREPDRQHGLVPGSDRAGRGGSPQRFVSGQRDPEPGGHGLRLSAWRRKAATHGGVDQHEGGKRRTDDSTISFALMRILFRCVCSRLLFPITLAACAGNVQAGDEAPTVFGGIAAANGDNVDLYGIHAVWAPRPATARLTNLGLEPRLAAQVVRWHGRDQATAHASLIDASLLAVVHWPWPTTAEVRPFIEAGAGVHLLSHMRINDDRQLGSGFQFGSQAGAGIAFGARQRWELAALVHHVSNARLAQPNDGVTYFGAVLRYGVP